MRLFPRQVHGVEIINACREEFENDMAKIYCKHYGLIEFAGSDNHVADKRTLLAGVSCKTPVCSVEDFIKKVKNNEIKIFTVKNE